VLPDSERLRKSGLFQRVYNARKSVNSDLFTLYVLPRQAKSAPRLPLTGFVVAKKTLNKACHRNRAKRRVREAYRIIKNELNSLSAEETDKVSKLAHIKQWYAIVWVVQSDVLKAEYAEIAKSIRHCLDRANQKFGAKRASS